MFKKKRQNTQSALGAFQAVQVLQIPREKGVPQPNGRDLPRGVPWPMAHHGTSWDRRVRSIEILIFFILAPQKSPSFVCVKFSGLRYCDQQTYQDTCKRFFNPEFWTPLWEP